MLALLGFGLASPVRAQESADATIDDRLGDALHLLDGLADRDGTPYPDEIRSLGVQVSLASLPPGQLALYDRRARWISLTDRLLQEDPSAIATVLVHELEHVRDKDAIALGSASYDCLDLEVRAFEAQSLVWRTLRPELPANTPIERELSGAARLYERQGTDGLRQAIARVPFYQQECPAG